MEADGLAPVGRRIRGAAMKITRTFTTAGKSPYDGIGLMDSP
jgi:hypothetical protein